MLRQPGCGVWCALDSALHDALSALLDAGHPFSLTALLLAAPSLPPAAGEAAA